MKNKYRLLLFDLDGTLCDTDEMVVQSFLEMYKFYEPKVRRVREEIYYFSGPPIHETMKKEFPNYDLEEMVEAFRRISKEFYPSTVKEYPDEIKVLKALKEQGYLLGVVTNKGKPLTDYSLELCHIDGLFDVVISASDVINPKPDAEGVNKAMKLLGIKNKKEVLYIGDNDIDYHTAANAGVDALLVTWGPRKINCLKQAKYSAKSYNEIGGLLL